MRWGKRTGLRRPLLAVLACAFTVGFSGPAVAAVADVVDDAAQPGPAFTVNTADVADDGRCGLAHCSLAEAITAANGRAGRDSIVFDIAGPGPHTIQPTSPLPSIREAVVIDGSTQPGFSGLPLVELDGSRAPASSSGLVIASGGDGSTIRGLAVNRFPFAGVELQLSGNNVIERNFIGTDPTGTIARGNGQGIHAAGTSGNVFVGNVISANAQFGVILLLAAGPNVVEGNHIGTDAAGRADLGNGIFGVNIANSSDQTIGGTAAGAGNLISGNDKVGVFVGAGRANRIEGNLVGTDASGTIPLGNSSDGVHLSDSFDNLIGGTATGAGNVISGNGGAGVTLADSSSRNLVQGNLIGTDVTGMHALGNSSYGVRAFLGASGNTIGAGNVVAFNALDGVNVSAATRNAIRRNSIFSNGGLGIGLGTDGVTPNDPGDIDTGANALQNFPMIEQAESGPLGTWIVGTIDSAPGVVYTIELFASRECDPSGYGEGETFLGAVEVQTDASGRAAFVAETPHAVGAGRVVTAAANDPLGNTSEFSRCQPVVSEPPMVVYSGNEGRYTVDRTVAISCTASDALSGLASDTCADVTGPAYSFPLGTNTFSATATDRVGNVGSGSVTFEVFVTFESLCALTKRFVAAHGIAGSLCAKLAAAAAGAKDGPLRAYKAELRAQSGKALTAEHVAILARLADAL